MSSLVSLFLVREGKMTSSIPVQSWDQTTGISLGDLSLTSQVFEDLRYLEDIRI